MRRLTARMAGSVRTKGDIERELDKLGKRRKAVTELMIGAQMEGRGNADVWQRELAEVEDQRVRLEAERRGLVGGMKDDNDRLGKLIDQALRDYREGLVHADDPDMIREALHLVCGPIQATPDGHLLGSGDAANILSDTGGVSIQMVAGAGFDTDSSSMDIDEWAEVVVA